MTSTDDSPPGPLELIESAREKYTLALARLRHGPPELALLSLHGSIEDALRGHALRQRLPAATEPFPQLLAALAADRQATLSAGEAEGVRRMHRLRARVAHGEQIAVTATTIDAYRRLAARLLPRHGVMVVGPEDEAEPPGPPMSSPDFAAPRHRSEDADSIPPRRDPDRGRTTTRLSPPPRERSAYPDDQLARYAARPRRGSETHAPFDEGAGRADALADRWRRSQAWVLPLLIIVSIILIGAAITISLQQLRAAQAIRIPATTQIIAMASQTSPSASQAIGSAQPQRTVATVTTAGPTAQPAPGALATGRRARVSAGGPALNVRDRPGIGQGTPVFILQPDTRVDIVEGPVQADGIEWWKVRVINQEGWCAGQYLEGL